MDNNIFGFDNDIEIKDFDLEQFLILFVPMLQGVLNNKFGAGNPKTKIKRTYKSLNFSCPYCGDGKHVSHRGHIYFKTMSYKCWNDCHVRFTSLAKFLDDFQLKQNISYSDISYIQAVFNQNMSERGDAFSHNQLNTTNEQSPYFSHEQGVIVTKPAELIEVDNFAYSRDEIMSKKRLKEIDKSSFAINYLMGRKIIKNVMDVYSGQKWPEFAVNEYFQDIYLFNLASNKKDILGIQIRHLSPKSSRRFTTMNFGDISKKIFDIELGDEIADKFNKLSMYWNIQHVDLSKRFYILEGTMDAYFIPNSIACWGLSNFLYHKQAYYITDNTILDPAGAKKAVDLLDRGHHVFLWGKFTEDHPMYRDCKDINDCVKKNINFDPNVVNDYFSNDAMSMVFLQ